MKRVGVGKGYPDLGKTQRALVVFDMWHVWAWADLCGWGSRQGNWDRRREQDPTARSGRASLQKL